MLDLYNEIEDLKNHLKLAKIDFLKIEQKLEESDIQQKNKGAKRDIINEVTSMRRLIGNIESKARILINQANGDSIKN